MTDRSDMDIARLRELLDAYGADVECFPPEAHDAAEALISESTEARALVERASDLDQLLSQAPELEPSPALRRSVAEIPLRHPRTEAGLGALWPFATIWRAAFAGAFCVALGVFGGLSSLPAEGASAPVADSGWVAAEEDDWAALEELAFAAPYELDEEEP